MALTHFYSERRRSQKGFIAPPRQWAAWKPYAGVLVSLAGVLAINTIFSHYLQGHAPLLGITLPIMIGAIYGGLRPALVGTLVSLLAGIYIVGVRWGDSLEPYQLLQIVMFLIVGFMITLFGIQHRSAQAKLAEQARVTGKSKDDFLAMLGHELRNPLSGISAAAQLLVEATLDERGNKECANIIRRQSKHMTDLLNDLLDVSRVNQGKVVIERVFVDLGEVMHAAVEQVSELVKQHEHRLVLNLPTEPVWVRGDKTRLVQVVTNLLVNAARYTPNNGVLTLTLSATQDHAQLSVQDNGIGITQEMATKVFEIFTQATRSTDGKKGGLGLGLSLVKSMVEAHGGKATVYSVGLSHGSTFSVTLPLAQPQPQPQPQPQRVTEVNSLDILLVEDNQDAAQTLAMMLAFEGHRVDIAYNGQEAMQHAEKKRFDAAILDIGLPDTDGYTLARRFREIEWQSTTRLVALTGYGSAQDIAKAFEAGFDQHITKPIIDCDILLAALQPTDQRVSH